MLALLATGAALLVAGSGQPGAVASLPHRASGGTFKVSFVTNALDSVDPALSYTEEGWALLDATCARLLNYPDKPAPEGLRLVPEVAAGYPRVSKDAKTYTFRLRTGFRFSDGAPIRAGAFARAINRILGPGITSGGAPYMQDIVGSGREERGGYGRRRGREPPRRQVHTTGPRLPRADDHALLLRSSANAPLRP